MTKKEKISFAGIVKKTYEAIEKINPEFADNFHFGKNGEIILDNVAIEACKKGKNGMEYCNHYDEDNFIDFCKSGKIKLNWRFENTCVEIPIDAYFGEE